MAKNIPIKIANQEFVFQNRMKEKLAADLIIANEELKMMKDYQKEYIQGLEEMMLITQKLRHPITQILGLSILLSDHCFTHNEQKKMNEMMGDSAHSLDNFTRGLTTFIHQMKLK